MLEDDPVLGKFIASYPASRSRLLLQGAAAYAAAALVIQVAFASLDDETASRIVISALAVLAIAIGWYVSHLWNREVVFYERGFSYREGSHTAFIKYVDVVSLRQRAEKMRYFGVVRYTIYRFTVRTVMDEIVVFNNIYHRVGELGARLEAAVQLARRPEIDRALEAGERAAFGDTLFLSAEGLHEGGRDLPWSKFAGYKIQNRRLILSAHGDETWYSVPLTEVDNITLLLDLLKR